jgi:hypothetical protein
VCVLLLLSSIYARERRCVCVRKGNMCAEKEEDLKNKNKMLFFHMFQCFGLIHIFFLFCFFLFRIFSRNNHQSEEQY